MSERSVEDVVEDYMELCGAYYGKWVDTIVQAKMEDNGVLDLSVFVADMSPYKTYRSGYDAGVHALRSRGETVGPAAVRAGTEIPGEPDGDSLRCTLREWFEGGFEDAIMAWHHHRTDKDAGDSDMA